MKPRRRLVAGLILALLTTAMGHSGPARADAGTATLVTVTAGQTTAGIDAKLAAGALVAGIVTDLSGNALPGVCVLFEDTAGIPVLRQPTDTNGNYRIDQLPAGRFILEFVDDGCVGRAPRYAPTFLGGSTPATATVLNLRAGEIDGQLNAMLAAVPSGGGTGSGGTGSGGGAVPVKPVAGGGAPAITSSPRRAVLSLLGSSRGRWTVDRQHRLHLRVRCETAGPICRVKLTVSRVRRHGTHLVAGAWAGSRSATIRPGRTRTIIVSLRRYGEPGHEVAVRAELHRLRDILGPALATRPYRLAGIDADFDQVRQRLASGRIADARAGYPGPLLPRSEVPEIVAAREQLELAVAVDPAGSHEPSR